MFVILPESDAKGNCAEMVIEVGEIIKYLNISKRIWDFGKPNGGAIT